jgi:hypothetical protein
MATPPAWNGNPARRRAMQIVILDIFAAEASPAGTSLKMIAKSRHLAGARATGDGRNCAAAKFSRCRERGPQTEKAARIAGRTAHVEASR